MPIDTSWVAENVEDFRRKTWGPNKSQRLPKRAILKNGNTNMITPKIPQLRRWRYLQDIVTTLLDTQWRWTLQFLGVAFFGSWLFFALIWWLIAFVHGDLHENHLPANQENSGWTPCVQNIHGFQSCFLYSMETQHTTGYGLRVITEECPEAIFILCLQCIVGMMIDSFTVGIVFAKMVRAKLATYTIQFSRNAVVCQRDEKLCLMFRVGDIRKSRIIGVKVRAILVKNERSREGEILKNYLADLPLKADHVPNNLIFLWPQTVFHIINENSPLYELYSSIEILNTKFEVIVILNATVESTGVSIEAKSSYLSEEILWGRRFESMVNFNKDIDSYEANWKKFDNTVAVEMESGHCIGRTLKSEDNHNENKEDILLKEDDFKENCNISEAEMIIFQGNPGLAYFKESEQHFVPAILKDN